MPHTVLLGRRWNIASDAILVPALCSSIPRLLWVSVVLGLFIHLQTVLQHCSRKSAVDSFISISICLFVTTIILEIAITVISLRGSIVATHARQEVTGLLKVHFGLGGVELILAIFGLAIVSNPDMLVNCESLTVQNHVDLIVAVVAVAQLIELSLKCCVCLVLVGPPVDDDRLPIVADHTAFSLVEDRWKVSHGRERWRWNITLEGETYREIGQYPPSSGDVACVPCDDKDRCRLLCTCARYSTCNLFSSGGAVEDLEMVGRVMADIFESEGYIDVVPSDIVAAFILVRHIQKAREHEMVASIRSMGDSSSSLNLDEVDVAGGSLIPHGRTKDEVDNRIDVGTDGRLKSTRDGPLEGVLHSEGLSRVGGSRRARIRRFQSGYYIAHNLLKADDAEDRRVLEEGTYFEPYAMAIYTWMMYLFVENPCRGSCSLTRQRLCGMSNAHRVTARTVQGLQEQSVMGDNCFRAHEAALREFVDKKDCDLIYARFTNSVYDRPYAIMVDHKWQCVVVTIRGTLSLEDCITDANSEPVSMEAMGKAWGFDGEGEFCHSGIMNAADCIARDLYDHQLLHLIIKGRRASGSPVAAASSSSASLSASMVAPLIHSCRGYSLRVVGHSLGAGTATLLSLMLKRDFPDLRCMAYSPPGALISRGLAEYCKEFLISFVLGRDLVIRMGIPTLRKLRDELLSALARCRVNKNVVFRSLLSTDSRRMVQQMLYPEDDFPPSVFYDQLQAYREHMRRVERKIPDVDLVPAGRIVHFVKSHQVPSGCCSKKQMYLPVWATPADFKEIYVSPSMATDHLPNRLLDVMEMVAKEYGISC